MEPAEWRRGGVILLRVELIFPRMGFGNEDVTCNVSQAFYQIKAMLDSGDMKVSWRASVARLELFLWLHKLFQDVPGFLCFSPYRMGEVYKLRSLVGLNAARGNFTNHTAPLQ